MFTRERAFTGAKQKGSRNIALKVLHEKDPYPGRAVDPLRRFTRATGPLFTDGRGIYQGISHRPGLKLGQKPYRQFEFTLTAGTEGLWGCFRTFSRRRYHRVTVYKPEELVPELLSAFSSD